MPFETGSTRSANRDLEEPDTEKGHAEGKNAARLTLVFPPTAMQGQGLTLASGEALGDAFGARHIAKV